MCQRLKELISRIHVIVFLNIIDDNNIGSLRTVVPLSCCIGLLGLSIYRHTALTYF